LRGREQVRAWFERLHRLFPNLAITPVHVVINGGPWNTVAATRFLVKATLPDGSTYENEGMQYVRICWGSVVEDRLYEDTDNLKRTLHALAQAGVTEANAPALVA